MSDSDKKQGGIFSAIASSAAAYWVTKRVITPLIAVAGLGAVKTCQTIQQAPDNIRAAKEWKFEHPDADSIAVNPFTNKFQAFYKLTPEQTKKLEEVKANLPASQKLLEQLNVKKDAMIDQANKDYLDAYQNKNFNKILQAIQNGAEVNGSYRSMPKSTGAEEDVLPSLDMLEKLVKNDYISKHGETEEISLETPSSQAFEKIAEKDPIVKNIHNAIFNEESNTGSFIEIVKKSRELDAYISLAELNIAPEKIMYEEGLNYVANTTGTNLQKIETLKKKLADRSKDETLGKQKQEEHRAERNDITLFAGQMMFDQNNR